MFPIAVALALTACGPGEFVQTRHIRVVDGDTLAVRGERMRIAGIDAPASLHARGERGKCLREDRLAAMAARLVSEWLGGEEAILLRGRGAHDRWGRPLVDVINWRGENLAQKLLESGLALPWDGAGRKPDWCRVGSG